MCYIHCLSHTGYFIIYDVMTIYYICSQRGSKQGTKVPLPPLLIICIFVGCPTGYFIIYDVMTIYYMLPERLELSTFGS